MKSLTQSLAVAVLAAMACTGLHAQTVDMKATIPFDFQAGNTLMPAGEYQIREQGPVVIVRGLDGAGRITSMITNGAFDPGQSQAGRLRFDRYGSEYFLKEIWSPFSHDGRQLLDGDEVRNLEVFEDRRLRHGHRRDALVVRLRLLEQVLSLALFAVALELLSRFLSRARSWAG